MSLELDLLETVMEHDEDAASREELEAVNRVVLEYIVKRKLLFYGGTAIDIVLKHKTGEGIYGPTKLPDYDFISDNNVEDSMRLANLLKEKGFKYVAVRQAQHGNTIRVKVNFASDPSADITYYPLAVFKHVPYLEIDNVRYVSPEYMRIDFYKSFTNPNNYYRWLTKDEYLRYRKLVDAYPLKSVKVKYEQKLTAKIRELYNILSSYSNSIIWTGVAAFNSFAQVMNTEQVPINYLEAYIADADKIAKEISDVTGYEVIQIAPLLDHYPAISLIVYKKQPLLALYNSSQLLFIPTITVKEKRLVSYHQLLLFFHIKTLQASIWKDEYYEKLARNLLYRLNNEREAYLNKNGLVGIEKGQPLSIFDFDFDNLPVSEARETSIDSFYQRSETFRYYPETEVREPITDYNYPQLDGLKQK